ncbi:flavodoxin domain-containing protein [Adlercreutzia sp. ZJ141]|uniref:flavodoxin domain-containing protein n=1 Tax=Adlercreutzia sp. ZJ141 TaxID=2709406 RepID=UPI0013EA4922|nr:flavodoxin domain-containing protein [Adlercreutzia sp. ZJ141]
MKTIVVYSSNTGFTEQYAFELSERLDCSCVSLKKLDETELRAYERVVFGGWVMGGMIMGLDKLRGAATPAAVFAVGCTPPFEEVIADIRKQNNLAEIPFYYLEGGFRFDKLGLPPKNDIESGEEIHGQKE